MSRLEVNNFAMVGSITGKFVFISDCSGCWDLTVRVVEQAMEEVSLAIRNLR